MKMSPKETIRMLMKAKNVRAETLSRSAGYATYNAASKVLLRDKNIQLSTYDNLLKVFDAKLFVHCTLQDGTERQIELDMDK